MTLASFDGRALLILVVIWLIIAGFWVRWVVRSHRSDLRAAASAVVAEQHADRQRRHGSGGIYRYRCSVCDETVREPYRDLAEYMAISTDMTCPRCTHVLAQAEHDVSEEES